jgi:hypothetical protein
MHKFFSLGNSPTVSTVAARTQSIMDTSYLCSRAYFLVPLPFLIGPTPPCGHHLQTPTPLGSLVSRNSPRSTVARKPSASSYQGALRESNGRLTGLRRRSFVNLMEDSVTSSIRNKVSGCRSSPYSGSIRTCSPISCRHRPALRYPNAISSNVEFLISLSGSSHRATVDSATSNSRANCS